MCNCFCKESACSACKVCNALSEFWVYMVADEFCYGAWCVKFSCCLAAVLKSFKERFVKFVKVVLYSGVVKIDVCNFVYKLAEFYAVFHVVLAFAHKLADYKCFWVFACKILFLAVYGYAFSLQKRKKSVVYKLNEFFACEPVCKVFCSVFFFKVCPVTEAESLWNYGNIVFFKFPFFFFCVKYF